MQSMSSRALFSRSLTKLAVIDTDIVNIWSDKKIIHTVQNVADAMRLTGCSREVIYRSMAKRGNVKPEKNKLNLTIAFRR